MKREFMCMKLPVLRPVYEARDKVERLQWREVVGVCPPKLRHHRVGFFCKKWELRRGNRRATSSRAHYVPALQRLENLARALEHRLRQPGEPTDFDSIRAVGASRLEPVQKK